jgi:hypothetical protein
VGGRVKLGHDEDVAGLPGHGEAGAVDKSLAGRRVAGRYFKKPDRDSELWPNHRRIMRATPVPTVAMDCGPLESRLDRLGIPGVEGRSGSFAAGVIV